MFLRKNFFFFGGGGAFAYRNCKQNSAVNFTTLSVLQSLAHVTAAEWIFIKFDIQKFCWNRWMYSVFRRVGEVFVCPSVCLAASLNLIAQLKQFLFLITTCCCLFNSSLKLQIFTGCFFFFDGLETPDRSEFGNPWSSRLKETHARWDSHVRK